MNLLSAQRPLPSHLGSFEVLGEARKGDASRQLCHDVHARGPLRLLMAKVCPPTNPPDPYAFAEMRDEARLAARAGHPSLPTIEAIGTKDGFHYVIHDISYGGTLTDFLSTPPRPPTRVILRIVLDVVGAYVAGLRAADDHHDPIRLRRIGIPPEDVTVEADGRARLEHIGVCPDQQDIRLARRWLAAAPWAAPEHFVVGMSPDERADVYALAAFVALTLNVQDREAQPVSAAGPRPDRPLAAARRLPGELGHISEVCVRALALEPSNRYPSTAELEEALRNAAVLDKVFGTHREVGKFVRAVFADELTAFNARLRDAAARVFIAGRPTKPAAGRSSEVRLKSFKERETDGGNLE